MPNISRAQRLLYEEIAFQFCGEIRKQCVHLAVVALREYIANWSKGELMQPDST